MNPDTMTTDECRDFIAECRGWTKSIDGIWSRPEWGDDHVRSIRAGVLPRHDHPIADTLDAAAESLPEGYGWNQIMWDRGRSAWTASAMGPGPSLLLYPAESDIQGIEGMRRAMFRCAAKAWMAVREGETKQ